ncbi:MAG: 50S ribosomal protein L23 [Chloroflexota bacterium]
MTALTGHQILVRPIITEKGTAAQDGHTYVFEVLPTVNKIQIKAAVQEVFGVRVTGVRVLTVTGKLRRMGRHSGMTRSWKKAYVTLAAGERIGLFEGV